MRARKWIVAGLGIIGGVIAVAAVSGSILEQLARARAARDIVMPGRLVDIGDGRRIQLDCRGSGAPTVVLESGLDPLGSLSWVAVHDSMALSTRVCAYSRAGVMWSDPAVGAFDSRSSARDLHAALTAAGESPPWVMAGHSIGGAYAMTFTQLFGDEVRGMVLVDASHPDQFSRFREATGRLLAPSASAPRIGAALAWTGLVRVLAPAFPATWPTEIQTTARPLLPTSLRALAAETQAVASTLVHAGEIRSLGDRPLLVLTAGLGAQADELAAMGLTAEQGERLRLASRALRDDQATWSRCGRNDVVEGSSHYIQFDRPTVVVAAVRDVVAMVRARQESGSHRDTVNAATRCPARRDPGSAGKDRA